MEDVERIKEAQERVRQETEGMKKGLDQQHQTLKESVAAKQKQDNLRRQEIVKDVEVGTQQDIDYARKIGFPTTRLFGRLSMWGDLPEQMRSQVSEQVTGLVDQAKGGDSVSQQILTGVQNRLLKENIDTTSLPSLDWQAKDQPPKS